MANTSNTRQRRRIYWTQIPGNAPKIWNHFKANNSKESTIQCDYQTIEQKNGLSCYTSRSNCSINHKQLTNMVDNALATV